MKGVIKCMNRADFMKQLESLLQNISRAEREEALQYYNDYFDDAGEGNEHAVIEALGNPAKVAENIKRDLYGTGSETVKVTAGDRVVIPYGAEVEEKAEDAGENERADAVKTDRADSAHKSSRWSTGTIVLIVVLSILASPILVAVAGVLLGAVVSIVAVLVGLLVVWFALNVGFGAVALSLLVTAVVLAVVAVICFFGHPLIGLSVLGVALLCGGIGLLFLMLAVGMAGVVTPAFWRWSANLIKKIFGGNKPKKTA